MCLGRHPKAKLPAESVAMHWHAERVAMLNNRHQVGHDGKTAHRRTHHIEVPSSQFEYGKQVFARFAPTRTKTKRQLQFGPTSTQEIWVGAHEPIIENVVVLQPGASVRARTVFRRSVDEIWGLQRVVQITVTPATPNPGNLDESTAAIRFETAKSDEVGRNLRGIPAVRRDMATRQFKLTKRLFDMHGYTLGRIGCDVLENGLWTSQHVLSDKHDKSTKQN